MKESGLSTEAGQEYALADDARHAANDPHKVFTLYEDVIVAPPQGRTAGAWRTPMGAVSAHGKEMARKSRLVEHTGFLKGCHNDRL